MDFVAVPLLDPRRVVVLLVDFQNDFCHSEPSPAAPPVTAGNAATAQRAQAFAASALRLGAQIVYTRQVLDPARLTERQRRRESLGGLCLLGSFGAELFLTPLPGAAIVDKLRYDIWQSTDWARYVEDHDVEGLVISGVELRCCVLHAVLGAEERGFAYTVPLDLVSGLDSGEDTYNEWTRRYLRDVHNAPETSAHLLDAWTSRR